MSKNSLEEMAAHYNRHPKAQPSSYHHNQLNSEPQFSPYDIEKLENLKRYNLSQIKNLFPPGKPQPAQLGTNRSRSSILEDETQSLHSETGSRYSSNHGSQAHFAQPNSYQSFSNSKYFTPSLGPTGIMSRNPIEDEPSIKRTGTGTGLMSFKGSPREANSNSTLRTLSKTVGVDKYPQETYFEHSDFDLYVDAMSKRIGEADIKSKFNELKHSANLLKLIAEAGPEDDIEQIFSKHMTPDLASVLDSSKPLYKMVAESGVDYSALRNMREEQQQQLLISGRHSLQESSRGNTQRGDANSMVLNSAKRKVDSQGKLSDKQESFEAFLMDQGIGAPVYANANANTGKPTTKEAVVAGSKQVGLHDVHSHGHLLPQDNNNSFSFIKQMDDHSVSMMQSQAGGVSADLHMFLMQNLREIMEVKDILRDGIAYGIMESRENLRESREERRDNDGPSALFTQNGGDEDQLQQKLHEGQMERLVNKVQALNDKLKKYEQESLDSKRMSQAMKKCLRIGKVRLSELITVEVDIAGLTLDYLAKDFPSQARYLYVYTTHLAFTNDASETEKEQRFHLSEIEQIYYLEKPGSTFFMMKMLDKDEKDKSWTQESLKLSSQVRTKTIESLSYFYFIEIEDQAEMSAWELAFFVANFKIIAGNLSFSVNKIDFLHVVRSFVQKYLVSTGETSRSLVDLAMKPQIQVNGSPQLSRMVSTNSEQGGTEKLGIMDIWNRKKLNLVGNNIQMPAFVKKRSDDSEKVEVKEESVSAGNVPKKIVYQKQRSLPSRGVSAEDDLSSVEEGDSVGEGNLENSPDVREEKNRSNFIKTLSKGSTLELDDEVFSKNLAILLDGVVLSKYGKWGKSHDRHVKLSSDLMNIQWMHPLKGSKRRSGIEVNSIYSVLSGKKSMYFAKKKMLPPELELCFSIVAKSRSLHLQAPNLQTRDYFVEALEYIIKDKNKLKKVAEQADMKMRK